MNSITNYWTKVNDERPEHKVSHDHKGLCPSVNFIGAECIEAEC
jgi:hypothetical protein